MTRKELQETKEQYEELARECMASEAPYPQIVGVCQSLANEMCYNHHERGQRLWAFFQALNELKEG